MSKCLYYVWDQRNKTHKLKKKNRHKHLTLSSQVKIVILHRKFIRICFTFFFRCLAKVYICHTSECKIKWR